MNRKLSKVADFAIEYNALTCTTATANFYNNQTFVILGDSQGNGDVYWSIDGTKHKGNFQTSPTELCALDLSSNAHRILSGNSRGSVFLHDLHTLKNTETYTRHTASVIALQATNRNLVLSGSLDTTIRVWDERQKAEVMILKGHTGAVLSMKISPDDQWIASTSEDGTVRIWDFSTAKVLTAFNGPELKPLACVAFNPEEIQIAAAGLARRAAFFDLEKFAECGIASPTPSAISCLTFDAKGSALYIAGNNFLREVSTKRPYDFISVDASWKAPQKIFFNNEGAVFGLAKTASGATLFTCTASENALQKSNHERATIFNEAEDINCARKSHNKIIDILEKKISDLTYLVNAWLIQPQQQNTYEILGKINDPKVLTDIFNMMLQNSIISHISVELATLLVKKINLILEVKYKFFIKVGLNFGIEILKIFGPDIKSAKSSNFVSKIDLTREERLKNYDMLLNNIRGITNNTIFNKMRIQYKHEEIGILAQKYIAELETLTNLISTPNV